MLNNPRFAAPVQLGTELAKVLFTDREFANSTLTGRRVNGQIRQPLDAGKLCLVDSLVKQMCGLAEAESSSIRSGIRDSLVNQCKYLPNKLAPKTHPLFRSYCMLMLIALTYLYISIVLLLLFLTVNSAGSTHACLL